MKSTLVKALCCVTPIKSWRHALRETYRTDFSRLEKCCDIAKLSEYKKLGIKIHHPVGIVISKDTRMGQNVSS